MAGNLKRGMTVLQHVSVLAILLASPAIGLVIDDFNDAVTTQFPPGITQSVVGTTTVVDPGLTGVIGNVRQLNLTALALVLPFPIGPDRVNAGAADVQTFFTYSSTLGATGQFELVYDRGGAGLNASLVGLDHFQLVVVAADADTVPYQVVVTLKDNSANTASSTQTITVPGGRIIIVPMADFVGVDLASVESIRLLVSPLLVAADLVIDRFDAVPATTPAPVLSPMMIFGLIGVLGFVGVLGLARSR